MNLRCHLINDDDDLEYLILNLKQKTNNNLNCASKTHNVIGNDSSSNNNNNNNNNFT